MSLPQKPRTPEQMVTFRRALGHMGILYAHPATAVVQVKGVPERPRAFDGCVIAFSDDLVSVEQSGLCGCDGFERCEPTLEGCVRVRFATHEQATRAVEASGAVAFGLCPEYNDRPYETRGWVRALFPPPFALERDHTRTADAPLRGSWQCVCLRSAWARSRGPSS